MDIKFVLTLMSIALAIYSDSVMAKTDLDIPKETGKGGKVVQVQNLFTSKCDSFNDEFNKIENRLNLQTYQMQRVMFRVDDYSKILNKTHENSQKQNDLIENQLNSIAASLKNQDDQIKALTTMIETIVSRPNKTSVDPAVMSCCEGFTEFNGKCYIAFNLQTSWADALKICKIVGGTLAEPRTKSENIFINEYVNDPKTDAREYFWLGGSDQNSEGEWIWVSDASTISGFTNWGVNGPYNCERCDCMQGVFSRESGGVGWSDRPCDEYDWEASVVCQAAPTSHC